jgi:putative hydroxymethylpyrimidine transport system permease protein
MKFARVSVLGGGLVAVWQIVVWLTQAPPYILPGPVRVMGAMCNRADVLIEHTAVTTMEIILGLLLGTLFGGLSALTMMASRRIKRWLLPVLVISQAVPVFALAPILVLWLGYGMPSKVAMAVLIIYFPVTAAFFDGLRRTDPQWIELAQVMGADAWAVLRQIRLPAALPAFASGLRVATAVAPIGAIVGEWVGASEGLGYYMLHANGRMEIDAMFAALVLLAVVAVTLYFTVNRLMSRIVYWQPEEKGNVVTP